MGFPDENFCANAPWRDKTERKVVRVTRIYVDDVEIDLPDDCSDDELKELAKEYASKSLDDWYLKDEYIECV